MRITAQLVDATTGGHLWSERYDRPLKDIFALQDEIMQKIVLALKVKLTAEEQARFRKPTDNLDAYDFYLRGWRLGCADFSTRRSDEQARQLYEQAIALDPQYAAAYAGLGWTYFTEWFFQWNPDRKRWSERFALAQQAVALDDSLPEPTGLRPGLCVAKAA